MSGYHNGLIVIYFHEISKRLQNENELVNTIEIKTTIDRRFETRDVSLEAVKK